MQNSQLTMMMDNHLVDAITELLQSALKTVILMIGGIYAVWALFIFVVIFPSPFESQLLAITPILALTCLATSWLVSRHLVLAQIVWQAGLIITITIALYLFEIPEIAFFYALLPLMAMITMNWFIGLFSEGVILLLIGVLTQSSLITDLPTTYISLIGLAGSVTLVLGWVITRALLTVTEWSLNSLNLAEKNLAETRQHRAALMQMGKNLDHANYQLERANADLVAAWRVADEAERFKTEFVNNLSHELRTPLNLIVGFSEIMMTSPESYDDVLLPTVYRGDMNSIYYSAQHLLALVDDVLDLGRINAGKITLVRDRLNLPGVITEAVSMMHDYISAKGLELRTRIDPDLPQVWADRLRIRQVMLNLLVNSARFTEQGWIEITVEQVDETVWVKVADTGPGIPENDLPKIFEEFRSTDQPLSTWHSGTGLGLPISYKFVALHGGTMGVESIEGQGATFWFTIPMVPVLETHEAEEKRTLPPIPLRSTERIIIVVHQDPKVALVIQRYLEGYHIIGADTIEAGLMLADQTKAVALIAEDIDLADVEITEAAALPRDCLVISCPLPSGRWAALMLGTQEFLTKPVSRERLFLEIDKIETPIERILVVDDKPEVVSLFERMLSSHPTITHCIHAYNGEEALEQARDNRPDLILLDLVMPDLDGQAVLERLATDPAIADIPVIIVSAEGPTQFETHSINTIKVFRPRHFEMSEMTQTFVTIFQALNPAWHQLGAMASEDAAMPPG
ncbi:MAG: ATP-binding protein [Chloroflexota bacterium]